tara:strand:+ start:357 stop:1409 length:1053 start_codon:yes stop_codon:yes gene_type:complete
LSRTAFYSGLALILPVSFCVSPAAHAAGEVFLAADVHASSEPVSVSDMIHGWDDGFTRGEYAYADLRLSSGVRYDDWQLSAEKRWYYYFTFSKDMSEFYYNMEHDLTSDKELNLKLDVKSFRADGIRLAKLFSVPDWQFQPSLALYKVDQYQFGSLDGVSLAGSGASASATLDYHFDEDKILEYPVSDSQGYGTSLDLNLAYTGFTDWTLRFGAGDVLNRWYFNDAGFTMGCINVGSSAGITCASSGSASGRAGQSDYDDRIPMTLTASAQLMSQHLLFSAYRHDEYQRLSAEKGWQTPVGLMALSVHSTRQLGLHWRSAWHNLSLITDDNRLSHARDLQINLGVNFHWR